MTHKVFKMSMASIYPHYVTKVEKKGRTSAELEQVIEWLLGYTPEALHRTLEAGVDAEHFITEAPCLNPNRNKIKGLICGHRVEEIEDPLMRELRYLDKVVDELARGKKLESILRA